MTVSSSAVNNNNSWFMPNEFSLHKRTWMAFGPRLEIWEDEYLSRNAQRDLTTIAKTIAKYEPVTMLVRENHYALAKNLLGSDVELIVCPLDDIWMRDKGPIFVLNNEGKKAGISFNFNGWGGKQECALDAKIAAFVTSQINVELIRANLTMEGGGIEVDGQGTAIFTESCILNANRNPAMSKEASEIELKRLLGLKKIIWLPGIKGKEITDGHVDCYARFTPTGTVVVSYNPNPAHFDCAVTKVHIELLKTATDANGHQLKLEIIDGPTVFRETPLKNDYFAEGYLNYYVCNGAVIAQEFGDTYADGLAKEKLQTLFPNRVIEMINIDAISGAGGGIHCVTQQEPAN